MNQYCNNCGTRLNGEAFCPKCQKPVAQAASDNPAPQPPAPQPNPKMKSVMLVVLTAFACLIAYASATSMVSSSGWVERKTMPMFFGGLPVVGFLCGILGGKQRAAKFISIGFIVWTAIVWIACLYYDNHVEY